MLYALSLFIWDNLFHCLTTLTIIIVFFWLVGLLQFQLSVLVRNLTTNEYLNRDRYSHFWRWSPKLGRRVYRNPFDKGSWINNLKEFYNFAGGETENWTMRETMAEGVVHVEGKEEKCVDEIDADCQVHGYKGQPRMSTSSRKK